MRLFGMGMPEIIVILLIALVIFGPKNLPKLGSALGKAVKGVREGVDSVNTELGAAKEAIDAEKAAKEEKEAQEANAPVKVKAVVEDVPVEAVAASAAGFCSQCGTALEADSMFCKKCGTPTS